MSEIRKISLANFQIDLDIMCSKAIELGYTVERHNNITLFKYKNKRSILKIKDNELIYDNMYEDLKNNLLNATLKEQIQQSLYKHNLSDFEVIEDNNNIIFQIRWDI